MRIYEKTYELWNACVDDQAEVGESWLLLIKKRVHETFIRGGYYAFQYIAVLIMLNTMLYHRDNNVISADPDDPAGPLVYERFVWW